MPFLRISLCQLLLSAHSMVVERAVSHYNIFRNDKRLSMSLQTVNDSLLIALNGNGTGQFDPRPAVISFALSNADTVNQNWKRSLQ